MGHLNKYTSCALFTYLSSNKIRLLLTFGRYLLRMITRIINIKFSRYLMNEEKLQSKPFLIYKVLVQNQAHSLRRNCNLHLTDPLVIPTNGRHCMPVETHEHKALTHGMHTSE